MSQISLKDLLGNLQKDFAEDIQKAEEGVPSSGAWDVDLPLDREYRAVVANCTYGAAKSSGKPQFVFTFEIVEPEEFAGAKFQEYVAEESPNEFAARSTAQLFGALGGFKSEATDKEGFAAEFIDRTAIIAVRKWGDEPQRTGLRWANADRGQAPRTGIKPPKDSKPAANIRPDIVIPKDEPEEVPTSAVVPPTEVAAPAPAPAQTTSLPGGVNLPPGLRS